MKRKEPVRYTVTHNHPDMTSEERERLKSDCIAEIQRVVYNKWKNGTLYADFERNKRQAQSP